MSDQQLDPANRVKVGHLVAGLVFLGVAALWALHATGTVDDLQTRVVLPALLVVAGIIGLTAMVVQNRRRSTTPRLATTDTTELEEEQS